MALSTPTSLTKLALRWCYASVKEVVWLSLGILLHLLCIAWILNLLYAPRPSSAAPELIVETLELTLAEVESETSTEAVTPELAAAQQAPTPDIAPYLTDTESAITLPEAPPPPEMPMPEISGFPMPEIPLPALPDQPEDLPAITLPPLQAPPPTTPKETPQQATGATARVQQPELLTDLSALRKSYPAVARRNGWEGTVTLRLRITANGRLDSAEVIQSSGYKVLDNEAAKMLRRARFRNGPGELIQSITYSLEAHSARPRH